MVVGKTARTKQWVSGQQIDSFSDLEAGSGDDDEDGKAEPNGVHDDDSDVIDPVQDWEAFEDIARRSTSSSRTKVRTEFLKGPLLRAISKEGKSNGTSTTHISWSDTVPPVLTPQQLSTVLRMLMLTYPRYIDKASRGAVQGCLSRIFDCDLRVQDGRIAAATLKWLDSEVNQKICGPTSFYSGSTVLNLVCWTVTLFDCYLKALGIDSMTTSPAWATLVKCLAVSFDALQASRVKKTVKQSGILYVRALVRKVGMPFARAHPPAYGCSSQHAAAIPLFLEALTTARDITPKTAAMPFLGLVIACSIRLKPHFGPGAEQGLAWVQSKKNAILQYYRENILASRVPIEPHILVCPVSFTLCPCPSVNQS